MSTSHVAKGRLREGECFVQVHSPQAEEALEPVLCLLLSRHPAPGGRQILMSLGTWSPLGHLHYLHTEEHLHTHPHSTAVLPPPFTGARSFKTEQAVRLLLLLPSLFLGPTHPHSTVKSNGRNKLVEQHERHGFHLLKEVPRGPDTSRVSAPSPSSCHPACQWAKRNGSLVTIVSSRRGLNSA